MNNSAFRTCLTLPPCRRRPPSFLPCLAPTPALCLLAGGVGGWDGACNAPAPALPFPSHYCISPPPTPLYACNLTPPCLADALPPSAGLPWTDVPVPHHPTPCLPSPCLARCCWCGWMDYRMPCGERRARPLAWDGVVACLPPAVRCYLQPAPVAPCLLPVCLPAPLPYLVPPPA